MARIFALALLMLLSIVSSWMTTTWSLPIPAPLLGLLLLFVGLILMSRVPSGMVWASGILLRYLSLFFVPATLSVILFKEQLLQHGWLILTTLVISTLISMLIAAWVTQKYVVGQSDV